MGEVRAFVVIATFLVMFTIVLGFIPKDLLDRSGLGIVPAGPFDTSTLQTYADVVTFKANTSVFDTPVGLGIAHTYDLDDFSFIMRSYTDFPLFEAGTYWLVLGVAFLPVLHYGEWQHESGRNRGDALDQGEIQYDYDAAGFPVRYRLTVEDSFSEVSFMWNSSTYANVTYAIDSGELWIMHGIGVNETQTSYNALQLLLAILTFQAPDIHPAINAMIAVPIYAAAGYLLLLVLEKFKPFG